jgi:hypothetical protein
MVLLPEVVLSVPFFSRHVAESVVDPMLGRQVLGEPGRVRELVGSTREALGGYRRDCDHIPLEALGTVDGHKCHGFLT